jgi:hypothetical protein
VTDFARGYHDLGANLVVGHGRIVFQGTPGDFGENPAVRKE